MHARPAAECFGPLPASFAAEDVPPAVGPAAPAAPINYRLPQRPPEQRRRRTPARPAGWPHPAPGKHIDEYAAGR